MKFVDRRTGKPPFASIYMLNRMDDEERENFAPVVETRAPWCDKFQFAQEADPQEVGGEWLQQWAVIDMSDEERQAIIDAEAAEAEAAKG